MITRLEAHLLCALLVALDLAARSARVRLLARAVGQPIRAADALRVNLLADAGASLSPMRLAGEPARIAGLTAAGVSLRGSVSLIAFELITAWPTLIALGALLVVVAAPTWWDQAGAQFVARAIDAGPALLGVLALSLVALLVSARVRRRRARWWSPRPSPDAERPVGCTARVAAASVALSAVNVVCRTALLPVLAMTLPAPPPAPALWLGAFALVYGQLVLPTPAGAGAVELGFLGGAAGEGTDELGLLLAWRWWATALPTLLGLAVGWSLRDRVVTFLRPAPTP